MPLLYLGLDFQQRHIDRSKIVEPKEGIQFQFLVPAAQRLDSGIRQINHHSLEKDYYSLLSYPVGSYLSKE